LVYDTAITVGLPSALGEWLGCTYILHWLLTGSWTSISSPAGRGLLCLLLGSEELPSSWYDGIQCCFHIFIWFFIILYLYLKKWPTV